jgi:hypothetical protein
LTDALVFEVLELCADRPLEKIEEKYVLSALCSRGYWEQAALWVAEAAVPSWNVQLTIPAKGYATASIVDPANAIYMIKKQAVTPGRALIEVLVEARIRFNELTDHHPR